MSRVSLIKLIHVARRALKLDDDTYRAALQHVTGKMSCRELKVEELEKVLKYLEEKGFRRTRNRSPVRRQNEDDLKAKVRCIWQQMHKDGFIHDGSDTGLDAFVAKMTVKTNDGKGIASLSWCRGDNLLLVLESIKQWHLREMKAVLRLSQGMPEKQGYDAVNGAFTRKVRKEAS
ncbi:Mu-like prophage protein gp16 [Pantoea sesami]|nr:Mu-like prophage protein gp16 [Pantoea sesami]